MIYIIEQHIPQIIATVIVLILVPLTKIIVKKLIVQYAFITKRLDMRTKQITRIFNILINLVYLITLVMIWGVNTENILLSISSVFAVIGVAMFAQWSLLSNITAGIIIFFSNPFHIGDIIKIHDKDEPIEARVDDIRAFHTILRKLDGEKIVYPNSLLFQKGVSIILRRE